MNTTPKPRFVFTLWAEGIADIQCADDMDLPVNKIIRILWRVRGEITAFLFGWWWWTDDKPLRPADGAEGN